jgi:hypothetical protein
MENPDLKRSAAEPEKEKISVFYCVIFDKTVSGLFVESLCFLTQDVHWVRKSSGEGVCRHD